MRERWTTYCLKQLRENLLICTIILSSPTLLQKGYIDKLMNFFQQTDSCRWGWGCVLVHWSDCLHATCFIKYINTLWCDALQWGNSVVTIPPLLTKLLTSWAMQLGRCSPSRSASKNQACKVRVYCAIAQWFEVCLYLVLWLGHVLLLRFGSVHIEMRTLCREMGVVPLTHHALIRNFWIFVSSSPHPLSFHRNDFPLVIARIHAGLIKQPWGHNYIKGTVYNRATCDGFLADMLNDCTILTRHASCSFYTRAWIGS